MAANARMPSVFLFYLLCAITDCPPPVSHQSTGQNGIGIRRQLELNFGASSDGRYARSHSNKLSDVTPPVVNTSLGEIQGRLIESRGGRVIAAFNGIPYALQPSFERRFRDPVPVGPWSGVLIANKTRRDCLQMDVSKQLRVRGSEDCLYLNVYSPLVCSIQIFYSL
ncbi:unnamed protein product [Orchesella dallaii]|uniref:Carboxylesterase type B domain-containing protein n=1 Tax=Orchesella dallaii TaxID=48710 RepID=A0ABP1PQD2_9HEXA